MAGKTQKAVSALRDKGLCSVEIAEQLHRSTDQINSIVKIIGKPFTDEERERSFELTHKKLLNDPADYISRYTNDVQYHHGYINCDSDAWVECKACHYVFKISMVTIRKQKTGTHCPLCKKNKPLDFKRGQKPKAGTQIQMKYCECRECGRIFVTTGTESLCSEECRHKRRNRKKDSRIPREKIVDKDITLQKLYKRDGGRCHICGGLCDINADTNSDIYPSIDHIQAVSQGGEHSWQNIKLAHRGCNLNRYIQRQKHAPLFDFF